MADFTFLLRNFSVYNNRKDPTLDITYTAEYYKPVKNIVCGFFLVNHCKKISDDDNLYYTVNGITYIHDFVSIFLKIENRESKTFFTLNDNEVEAKHFFDTNKLIESNLNEFVKFLRKLYREYQIIFDCYLKGISEILNNDSGLGLRDFDSVMEWHFKILKDIIVKYSLLAYEDTIRNNVLDCRNRDDKLLYLNKAIIEIIKIKEEKKIKNYEKGYDKLKAYDEYMDELYYEELSFTPLKKVKKWKKKLKILKRLRKETTLNIKEKNQKKSTPSTTKQQVLLFHYLEKLGVVKNFDTDKYFNGVENNKQKFLQHLFCRALPNVKKESINLSYPNRVTDIKTEANLKYLLELFKELKSKPLFDLVKEDCKEYDYHIDITYKN